MNAVLCVAFLAVIAFSAPVYIATAAATEVPCEDMLKALRAAEAAGKPTPEDAAKIKELESKGVERCAADDDARADEFFAAALKLLGK